MALRMTKRINDGEGRQKRCERLTSMMTIIGERKPNDRYDVRSRDCHATDAHMSYESSPMELVGCI